MLLDTRSFPVGDYDRLSIAIVVRFRIVDRSLAVDG